MRALHRPYLIGIASAYDPMQLFGVNANQVVAVFLCDKWLTLHMPHGSHMKEDKSALWYPQVLFCTISSFYSALMMLQFQLKATDLQDKSVLNNLMNDEPPFVTCQQNKELSSCTKGNLRQGLCIFRTWFGCNKSKCSKDFSENTKGYYWAFLLRKWCKLRSHIPD